MLGESEEDRPLNRLVELDPVVLLVAEVLGAVLLDSEEVVRADVKVRGGGGERGEREGGEAGTGWRC